MVSNPDSKKRGAPLVHTMSGRDNMDRAEVQIRPLSDITAVIFTIDLADCTTNQQILGSFASVNLVFTSICFSNKSDLDVIPDDGCSTVVEALVQRPHPD